MLHSRGDSQNLHQEVNFLFLKNTRAKFHDSKRSGTVVNRNKAMVEVPMLRKKYRFMLLTVHYEPINLGPIIQQFQGASL